MNKKKRARRDVEKLARTGRYWELLKLLESEGMVSEFAREWQDAWKAVVRQALLNEQGFDQFCLHVGVLKSFPNTPDFRLLMDFRTILLEGGSSVELAERKGLSPDGETLRSRFHASDRSSLTGGKLRPALEKFVREPDKITRRFFEQLAGLLSVDRMKSTVVSLGMLIPSARHFNQKAAVAKGWSGLNTGGLKVLDGKLHRLTQALPEHLGKILLHPFVHNIAVLLRRLAPEADVARAANATSAIPFLLPVLAGEKLSEVREKLSSGKSVWGEGDGDDQRVLERKVRGLSLEQKVSMLGELRIKIYSHSSKEPAFDGFDFFDHDDDSDDEEDWDSEAESLAEKHLLLFRSILADLSRRVPEMQPRERRELVGVMEPIVLKDMDFILEFADEEEEALVLLDSAIEAGCAGVKMGLVAILMGTFYRKADLRKRGSKLLNELPLPTVKDMEWLADEHRDFFYPSIRFVKPFLERYGNEPDLMAVFCDRICGLLEFDLLESAATSEMLNKLPFGFGSLMGRSKSSESKAVANVRREMKTFEGLSVMEPVRKLLECFPENRSTVEGNLCRLNALHADHPEGAWDRALNELRRRSHVGELSRKLPFPPMFDSQFFESLLEPNIEAVVLFVQEHLDELPEVPRQLLQSLLDELLRHKGVLLRHHPLMIRIGNLFTDRVNAGETDFRPLVERIGKTLQELSTDRKKTPKSRKSKR